MSKRNASEDEVQSNGDETETDVECLEDEEDEVEDEVKGEQDGADDGDGGHALSSEAKQDPIGELIASFKSMPPSPDGSKREVWASDWTSSEWTTLCHLDIPSKVHLLLNNSTKTIHKPLLLVDVRYAGMFPEERIVFFNHGCDWSNVYRDLRGSIELINSANAQARAKANQVWKEQKTANDILKAKTRRILLKYGKYLKLDNDQERKIVNVEWLRKNNPRGSLTITYESTYTYGMYGSPRTSLWTRNITWNKKEGRFDGINERLVRDMLDLDAAFVMFLLPYAPQIYRKPARRGRRPKHMTPDTKRQKKVAPPSALSPLAVNTPLERFYANSIFDKHVLDMIGSCLFPTDPKPTVIELE